MRLIQKYIEHFTEKACADIDSESHIKAKLI